MANSCLLLIPPFGLACSTTLMYRLLSAGFGHLIGESCSTPTVFEVIASLNSASVIKLSLLKLQDAVLMVAVVVVICSLVSVDVGVDNDA